MLFYALSALLLLCDVNHACPDVCTCNDNVVHCSNLNLQEIPSGIPTSTVELYLDNNQIQALGREYSPPGNQLTELKVLDLSHNNFSTLPNRAFTAIPNLETLKLDYNQLIFQSGDTIDPFGGPEPSLKHLSLSHNNLFGDIKKFTYFYFHKLTFLDLSYNQFTSIEEEAFPLNLEHLDLGYNKISRLSRFKGLKKLTYFDFRGLNAERLGEDFFVNLENLLHFRVGGEGLRRVFPMRGLHLLRRFDLVESRIEKLASNLLEENKVLTHLNLSNNLLDSISKSFFQNFTQLESLNLQHNKFKEIESLSTSLSSTKLLSLNIDFNNIRGSLDSLIASQPTLQNFSVAHNNIGSVSQSLSSDSLKILDLSSNKISRIHSKAFKDLSSLEELNLSSNNLTSFPEIDPSHQLTVFLEDNMWNCSCNFYTTFQNTVLTSSFSFSFKCTKESTDLSCFVCSNPATLRGVSASSLSTNTFENCQELDSLNTGSTTIIAIIVACIAFLVILIVILLWCNRSSLLRLGKSNRQNSSSTAYSNSQMNVYNAIYNNGENEYGEVGPSENQSVSYAVASDLPPRPICSIDTSNEATYSTVNDVDYVPSKTNSEKYQNERSIEKLGGPQLKDNGCKPLKFNPPSNMYEIPISNLDQASASAYIYPDVIPTIDNEIDKSGTANAYELAQDEPSELNPSYVDLK